MQDHETLLVTLVKRFLARARGRIKYIIGVTLGDKNVTVFIIISKPVSYFLKKSAKKGADVTGS